MDAPARFPNSWAVSGSFFTAWPSVLFAETSRNNSAQTSAGQKLFIYLFMFYTPTALGHQVNIKFSPLSKNDGRARLRV